MATCVLAQAPKEQTPTVLAAADHRSHTSLNGPWHAIIDPYQTGLFDFHGHARNDGYAMNAKQIRPGQLVEYSFAKSPTLQVPGDWNTQRESLMFYEGTVWYEKDFTYKKTAGKRVFLHIGAANYRSYIWVNTDQDLRTRRRLYRIRLRSYRGTQRWRQLCCHRGGQYAASGWNPHHQDGLVELWWTHA